jgi:hypothetical protein
MFLASARADLGQAESAVRALKAKASSEESLYDEETIERLLINAGSYL